MKFTQSNLIAMVGGPLLVVAGYMTYGWAGVALVIGGGLMWALLHFSRTMQVLKRAANKPVGWVGSAVMLNSRLSPGLAMLQVVRLTTALGKVVAPLDANQNESWQWSDEGDICVTVWFTNGKVTRWEMVRPAVEVSPAPNAQSPAPPTQ